MPNNSQNVAVKKLRSVTHRTPQGKSHREKNKKCDISLGMFEESYGTFKTSNSCFRAFSIVSKNKIIKIYSFFMAQEISYFLSNSKRIDMASRFYP